MTGASIFVINAAAQNGARLINGAAQSDVRAEVGAPGTPGASGLNGLELLAGGVMLIGAIWLSISVIDLLMRVDWRGPKQ